MGRLGIRVYIGSYPFRLALASYFVQIPAQPPAGPRERDHRYRAIRIGGDHYFAVRCGVNQCKPIHHFGLRPGAIRNRLFADSPIRSIHQSRLGPVCAEPFRSLANVLECFPTAHTSTYQKVKLLKGDRRAITLFEQIDEDADLCASCLTIFELKRLSLRGELGKDAVNQLIEHILSLCRISWIDNVEINGIAAGLSHGLGIPAVDSLILAGFILNGSETIYTTDSHLEKYVKKGIRVIKL
jgi:predicted nucleic acid-binding protein